MVVTVARNRHLQCDGVGKAVVFDGDTRLRVGEGVGRLCKMC